jgi:hypothetical protein
MDWKKTMVKVAKTILEIVCGVVGAYVVAQGTGNEQITDMLTRTVFSWVGLTGLTVSAAITAIADWAKHK